MNVPEPPDTGKEAPISEETRSLLAWDAYPRSAKYDPAWVLGNEMGPNVLWLTEALAGVMDLKPGMRVLDLGCGRGMSSVFLAKEFGVQVFAADLWISPTDNFVRFEKAGLSDRVFPIQVEAHSLPFARSYFDAALSMDAYHYFGTDDLYLKYFAGFLKEGAQVGIVVPGLAKDFEGPVPGHLTRRQENGSVFWDPKECFSFHTASWWKRHWEVTGLIDVERAERLPGGWELWLRWEKARQGRGSTGFPSEAETLEADGGRYLGFVRMTGRKR